MVEEHQKLQELCRKVTSGGTPSRSNPSFWNNGSIPWMKTGEVKQGFVYSTGEHITQLGMESSAAKIVPKNSVIVALYGDGNTAGSVAINKIPLTTNQACCNLIVDGEKAHYGFIYYYLKGSYNNLVNLKSGGSQQNLNGAIIKSFPIRRTPLSSQRKIAAILTAYDDLIEVNKRRVALLEKMAEELYREWFVRMRFPGHQDTRFVKGVPEGWEIKSLPGLAAISYGFPFQSQRFNTLGIGKPIIRIRNIPSASTLDYTDEEVSEKYLVDAGDLLVGMDGEFHINHWYGDQAYLVQRVCRIRPKSAEHAGYLALAIRAPIKHLEAILASSGATVGHLGAKHLNSMGVWVPPEKMKDQLKLLNKLFEQKLHLSRANQNLTKTRDLLLPRLISGKLSVEDLDIQFPPSMCEEAA